MTNLSSFGFSLPTKVIVEKGVVSHLPAICREYGSRILFVYSADLKEMAAPVENFLQSEGFSVHGFAQATPEPTCDFIDAATDALSESSFDLVVGLGGGSAIDLAKAFAISLTQTEGIWMYANLSNRPPLALTAPVLPVVAMPTTSGTGSEVTPYAVLTKKDTQQKGTIQEPSIFPKAALIDPTYTAGMPQALTAATGMDAFAHALEATINISKPAPMAELFGKAAMKLIFEWLPKAYKDGTDLVARQQMAYAATLAGMAISHRGTTAAHAIAEPLGALTHIPHGTGVTISTVPVLRHSLPQAASSLAPLWREVLGKGPLESEFAEATAFVDSIEALIASLGLRKAVRDLLDPVRCEGLPELLVSNILEFKFRPLKQHPVEFFEADLLPLANSIVFGDNA